MDLTNELDEIVREMQEPDWARRIITVQLKLEQLLKENKLEGDLYCCVLSEWIYGDDKCYLLNPKDYTFDADEDFFYIYHTESGQLKYKWKLTDLYEEVED